MMGNWANENFLNCPAGYFHILVKKKKMKFFSIVKQESLEKRIFCRENWSPCTGTGIHEPEIRKME